MNWINIKDHTPIGVDRGDWDGLRTEWLLVQNRKEEYHVARAYVGTMDGAEFCSFEDNLGYEVEDVVFWTRVDNPLSGKGLSYFEYREAILNQSCKSEPFSTYKKCCEHNS
jgi:hypothetical protein